MTIELGKNAPPRLKLIKSHRIRCYGCKAWIMRLPQWCNCELGKGWQCSKCGTTSISWDEGRPFGPRSRQWDQLVEEFHEICESFSGDMDPSYMDWVLSTVVVEGQAVKPVEGVIGGKPVKLTRDDGGNWWALCEGESGVVIDGRLSESRVRELIEKAENWQHLISLACLEVFTLAYTGRTISEEG